MLDPWIEVECPVCGQDFDEEPQPADTPWRCPGCHTVSRIGDIGSLYVPDGGEFAPTDPTWNATGPGPSDA